MRLMDLVHAFRLRDLSTLNRDEQLRVLAIRNEPEVRRHMYTDHVIGEDEHFAWIERLSKDRSQMFMAVELEGEIIGGASLSNISTHHRADWAFYLSPHLKRNGAGAALEFRFLDFAFEQMELLKLNCEVLVTNDAVVSLHRKFGFIEEGLRREHIRRNGEPIDVRLLGMTRAEWRASRGRLTERLFA